MPMCLEELQEQLALLAAAFESVGGSPNIAISLEQTAEANAEAASTAFSTSRSISVSMAEATAIAINLVNLDVRLEQTTIVELILPPVSHTEPPVLEDYPTESTGVTTVVVAGAYNGPACQLIYQYILGVKFVLGKFATLTKPLYYVTSYLMMFLEIQLKAAVALGIRFPIPKIAAAAFISELIGAVNVSTNPSLDLQEFLDNSLDAAGVDQLACLVWQAWNNAGAEDGTSFDMAQVAQDWVFSGTLDDSPILAAVAVLFGPSVWAAALYEPIWGVPATAYECDACGV